MSKSIPNGGWKKVYSEVLENPLLVKLPDGAFKLWIAMLLKNREGFVYADAGYWKRLLWPSAGPPHKPTILNWIAHFISAGMLRDIKAAELLETFEDRERGQERDPAELEERYLAIKNWQRYQSGKPRFRRSQPAEPETPGEEEAPAPPPEAPEPENPARRPPAGPLAPPTNPSRDEARVQEAGDQALSYRDFQNYLKEQNKTNDLKLISGRASKDPGSGAPLREARPGSQDGVSTPGGGGAQDSARAGFQGPPGRPAPRGGR